jgi:hypothetical protein
MSKKNYVVTPLSSKEQCSKARGNFSSPQVNDSLLQKEWNRGNQDGGVVEIEGGGEQKQSSEEDGFPPPPLPTKKEKRPHSLHRD